MASVKIKKSESVIHENVQEDFQKIRILLQDEMYDDVIRLSETILEWMPRCAEIFWIRLLASHRCTTAVELIRTGFICEEDANFINAVRYANAEQHRIYSEVQNKIEKIKQGLVAQLTTYIHEKKVTTQITTFPQKIKEQMELRRDRLFDLWSALEATEQKLHALELDCILISREYQDTLQQMYSTASSIKKDVHRVDQCNEKELHGYQVRLGATLQQSEKAKESLLDIKAQHPWVKEFSDLVKTREQQITAITIEMNALQRYEGELRAVITAFERIENNQRTVFEQIQNAQFRDVQAFLGDQIFGTVLRSVGIGY